MLQYLPPELTGLRTNLAAQDSTVDLTSGVEFNREGGRSMLAVFLDVPKACDRVSATRVLAFLQNLELRGQLVRFLRPYLEGRLFNAKLSKTNNTQST